MATKAKWEKGWKCVTIQGKAYFSYLAADDNPGNISYKINRFSKPKRNCGPLAVFKTYDDAIAFMWADCHANDSGVAPCLYKVYSGNRHFLWTPGQFKKDLPSGTALASCVKLTRKPKKYSPA
jgi:hypothetical protein